MAGTMAATGAGTAPAAIRAVPAFVRFVVFGGGVTLLGSGALLLVGDRAPVAAANAVVTVVTTLLATELHTRFTFRRGRASWSDHCASGLTVLLSYLFTTGALLGYDAFHTGGGALVRQGVYLAASGAAGIARFLLLRYVFARTRRAQSPTARGGRIAGVAGRAAGVAGPVVRAARSAWGAWGAWGAAPLARAVRAFRFAPVVVPPSVPRPVPVPVRVALRARGPVAAPGGERWPRWRVRAAHPPAPYSGGPRPTSSSPP